MTKSTDEGNSMTLTDTIRSFKFPIPGVDGKRAVACFDAADAKALLAHLEAGGYVVVPEWPTDATLYKLTDASHETHGRTKWGPNVTHETDGNGELCGPGWLHAYTSPLLAVLLNPIHGNFESPVLWEANGDIGKTDNGLKVGCKKLTTKKIIPLPIFTRNQKIYFAIQCALEVYENEAFATWARDWISGKDRSADAARAAARAALAAAAAAAVNAAYVADAAAAANAAYVAYVADAAAYVAHAAAHAARAAAPINLNAIAIAAYEWADPAP